MSALALVQVAALQAVAESVREFADNIRLDVYGNTRDYEIDYRVQEHFKQLADHLGEHANEVQRDAKDARMTIRGRVG